ncbi:MAG: hypothetical protein IKN63_04745 [Bacilli bacterium]|nr:hypothetical protein [Bacilli bacterium]
MKKITDKQQTFLNLIINFYKVNKIFPTIKDLKDLTSFKSYNTIYKYLDALERKNYIIYDKLRKQITYINQTIKTNDIIKIPFINQDNYFNFKNIDKDSFILEIHDNNLKSYGIYLNDQVVVKKELTHIKNKFVVIKNESVYKIYRYEKKGCFHYLVNDKEELIFENTNIIIGKVISLFRNM